MATVEVFAFDSILCLIKVVICNCMTVCVLLLHLHGFQ